MVGTSISDEFPKGATKKGDIVLSVDKLSQKNIFSNISFDIKKGEVVGFFGLVGAGRTESLKTIFGITHPTTNFKWAEEEHQKALRGGKTRIGFPARGS